MPVKKSQLYKNLWDGANALRGGMDASQYKDYVLILLFLKYISDKAKASNRYLLIVPEGCFFEDILKFKGRTGIGEEIDKAVNLIAVKNGLSDVIDVVSFNDDTKLGKGQEKIDRLSSLISIFEDASLNFSNNQAVHDDILGDAYEFLMRHFATESGKAKGQFYTPSEVSRVMAKILNLDLTLKNPTFYDPAAGSGSLLLKITEEYSGTSSRTSCYAQEKDMTTAGLAKMNMILHGQITADIRGGQSTISSPQFIEDSTTLKTFDYVVANPPFSLQNWTQGFLPHSDPFNRFQGFGIPPEKNGDFAFLLHIIASLKSNGRGAVILPHGVLFRGNAEGDIRKEIIKRKLIKAIIGLPSNLFYGTGIPACIILIDQSSQQDGIFMIDASRGFIKDGNKNRLREQDIRKIVDVFNQKLEIPKYSRLIPYHEIESTKNNYNLNISKYIDNQDIEDQQDIEAHLLGGIPSYDIDALNSYWEAFPNLKNTLFKKHDQPNRSNYYLPLMPKDEIKKIILNHQDYQTFIGEKKQVFNHWKNLSKAKLLSLSQSSFKVKDVILELSNLLLSQYEDQKLIDKYDFYQHLMNCWNDFMQDDLYLILQEGWKATPLRIIETVKKKGENTNVDKGWYCDLIPKNIIIQNYFQISQDELNDLDVRKSQLEQDLQELIEENNHDEGCFKDFDKPSAELLKNIKSWLKELNLKQQKDHEDLKNIEIFNKYIGIYNQNEQVNRDLKQKSNQLDLDALGKYPNLTIQDIQTILINKWMNTIERSFDDEMEMIIHRLVDRISELMSRYEKTLPEMKDELKALELKVDEHLRKMGFVW